MYIYLHMSWYRYVFYIMDFVQYPQQHSIVYIPRVYVSIVISVLYIL